MGTYTLRLVQDPQHVALRSAPTVLSVNLMVFLVIGTACSNAVDRRFRNFG